MEYENQPEEQKDNQKIQLVAQQVLKAMNQPTQQDSNAITFLNKLYKNNSSSKNKKMKSIRLNRFINMLDFIVNDFPSAQSDIQLLYCCIMSTLLNEKNYNDEEDDQLVQGLAIQFAQVINKLSETHESVCSVKILSYLLKRETTSLLQIDCFQEKIKQSTYYQNINLDSRNSVYRSTDQQCSLNLLEQVSITNCILRKIDLKKVYSHPFKNSLNKSLVVDLFYQHIRKVDCISKSKKQLFVECFLSDQKTTVPEAQAILKILEKQIFDRETINEIVTKISQEKLTLEELVQIDFKKIKGIQQVFIQSLLQQSSKKKIEEIITVFLNMKDSHNYFPLYLILKMDKRIPIDCVNLLFEDSRAFTVRKSIIFILSIIENGFESFGCLLKGFSSWNNIQKVRTKRMYQCALKAIHFSLQNVSKANVISTILKFIQQTDLNQESYLEYLGYNTLKVSTHEEMKHFLNQNNRQALVRLFGTLSQFQKMVKNKNNPQLNPEQLRQMQLQHKFRLDLQFIISNNPFVEQQILLNVKELNKYLDDSTSMQDLLKQLPLMKQNLLEVILMWINNKYEKFYAQEINNNAVDWAVRAYKKYTAELNDELKAVLEKEKLEKYLKLVKTLIEYGMEKRVQLKLDYQQSKLFNLNIKLVVNSANCKTERMSSNNFNDYFITKSKWKNYISCQLSEKGTQKSYKKIIWMKAVLIEIKQLITNMVKAEKAGNRKQIKNIIAENVQDVLALKIIHEYFDSEVIEGKELLIQIFRNVEPQFQFLQRAQKLASSLSIQYYSIYEELPHLLQNFNSDTLNFLAKLITTSKPGTGEKTKKSKKKNEKDNVPEDCSHCFDILVNNFALLFGDSNCMESYKSLFTILRRLVETQKIKKDVLALNLNSWLLQIGFIPSSNFQTWKNKVLALSKMWKNTTDLLSENKIQIQTLEKHFNLFTDLLNKLYENFREQPQFIQIEQKILLSLCLIYKQLSFDQIQVQNDMTDFIVKKFQQRNMSRIVLQNRFYYCYQCKKNACYACSSFLHRNHDKIYLGKSGNCEHENPKPKKQMPVKSQNVASLFGGVSAMLKRNQDLPEELLERITQKLMLEQQLKPNDESAFFSKIRQNENLKELFQSRMPKSRYDRGDDFKKKIRQKQIFKQQANKQQQNQGQVEQNTKGITPEAQDYFQYKQPYFKQFKKIHSQFNPILPRINIPCPKINVSPLAKVFLRQLQNQTFTREDKDDLINPKDGATGTIVTEIKERYFFFKNNNLKNDSRQYPYGRSRGGYGTSYTYGQGSSGQNNQMVKRNILACNKKFLFIPSSLSLLSLSMASIKNKLDKKIEAKQYSNLEQQKNYVNTPPANLPFDVLQTAFSKSLSYPILAAVGYNQICFYPISPDGRYARQINPEFHRLDTILKFSWINQTKNLFAIAYTNYIRIGGISPSNSIKTFAKAQIGKPIRDFDGYMNSKMYFLFVVDNQGKLYFIQVDFKDTKNTSFSATDRLINLFDQKGQKINDQIYSVKNIDGNKLLLSYVNGTLKVVDITRQSNSWRTVSFDLKKAFKIQNTIVLQTIKIIKNDDQSLMISAIGRKMNGFQNSKQKKYTGNLVLLKINENNHLSEIVMSKQENVESYDFSYISPHSLMFIYSNQEGLITIFKHTIAIQTQQIIQKITPNLSNSSIKEFNKKLLSSKIFSRIQEGGMLKNLEFKDNRVITNAFSVNTKQKSQIQIKQLQPCSNFATGISFLIQLPSTVTQYSDQNAKKQISLVKVQLKVMDCSYVFECSSKSRQIQLAFNLKQTLQLFVNENAIKISLDYQINSQMVEKQKYSQKQLEQFVKIKNLNIYGYEAKDLSNTDQISIYHTAYKQLVYDWAIYQQYSKQGLEEYFLNYYRLDFQNIEMKRLYKLKYDNANHGLGFKMNEINQFLKLELFSQTVSQSLLNDKQTSIDDIGQYIDSIKKYLLSKQFKRKSLQNSALRLCEVVCDVYQQKTNISVGHPYHRTSLVNYYAFSVLYEKWRQKKTFSTFQKMCNQLSSLVFVQAVDLCLIFQIYPELMVQISTFFNQLISDNKHKQSQDQELQNSVTKICSKYISIVCEYYQVLKNKYAEHVEQKMLYLLEQVFGKTKSDISKQVIMNPFLYLQSIFRLDDQTEIQCAIDLFNVGGSSSENLQNFFDLQRFQKSPKKIKHDSDMKQEQRIIPENNNQWQLIQEQKQMDEDEKQMYMEIQEQFDEEQEELMIEQAEVLELQSRKEKSSLKDQNVSSISLQEASVVHKNVDETITKILLSKVLNPAKRISVRHYDFSIQLAIALFRRQNYLTSSNIYFYLGLFYNLLKIIEDNLKLKNNKEKIIQLIQAMDRRIQNPDYSSLFIIVNFFVSPHHSRAHDTIKLDKSTSKISEYFIAFYAQRVQRFVSLLTQYNPKVISPMTKFADIMRFQPFELKNELYNLRLICNIYLSYRLNGESFSEQIGHKIKDELLFKVVKYKIPVVRNIMIFQKWEGQLEKAKILVSFQILYNDMNNSTKKQEGINMLHQCAISNREKFIQQLINDESKVCFLEQFSVPHQKSIEENIQKKIFELLQIYYSN